MTFGLVGGIQINGSVAYVTGGGAPGDFDGDGDVDGDDFLRWQRGQSRQPVELGGLDARGRLTSEPAAPSAAGGRRARTGDAWRWSGWPWPGSSAAAGEIDLKLALSQRVRARIELRSAVRHDLKEKEWLLAMASIAPVTSPRRRRRNVAAGLPSSSCWS